MIFTKIFLNREDHKTTWLEEKKKKKKKTTMCMVPSKYVCNSAAGSCSSRYA